MAVNLSTSTGADNLLGLLKFLGRALRRSLHIYMGLAIFMLLLSLVPGWMSPPNFERIPPYPNTENSSGGRVTGPDGWFERRQLQTSDRCSDVLAYYKEVLAKDKWRIGQHVEGKELWLYWTEPILERYGLNISISCAEGTGGTDVHITMRPYHK
jgi:hypothetical protein